VHLLIDGYNLLHALGMSPQSSGLSLERSRLRMLDWLGSATRDKSADICLVFDAAAASGTSERTVRGMLIRFSTGQTADDLIEQLIRDERVPSSLTVVSNDRRIQRAAQRRGCIWWSCGELLDWLPKSSERESVTAQEPEADKPAAPSSEEIDDWLKRFGG
jgi:predicted RNA-binding protein with PIN domain